jgi:hypothetical protein
MGGSIWVQTMDQKDAEIERRVQERMAQLLDNNTMLPEMIAGSVERAIRRVLTDPDMSRQFWKAGYEELSKHAVDGASQALGRRLLTAVVIAVTTAGIIWLAKTGALK